MPKRLLLATVAALVATGAVRAAPAAVTDDDVCRAIEKGREYLLNLRQPDGSFSADPRWRGCYTSLILMTLAYMGEHPNRDVIAQGMSYLLALDPERDFNSREGYALPIRVMALAYLHPKLSDEKRALARRIMAEDLARIIKGQSGVGGWRYQFNRSDYDFSVSQWPLLAMSEAGRVGLEFPKDALLAARQFYFRGQRPDGGWSYQFGGTSYGSMTAAGLASLFTIADLVEPASGCPCKGGRSQPGNLEIERRMDAALAWLAQNFTASRNPGWKFETNFDEVYYWLYSVERVGIAAGFKHFGAHNWYREGAEFLVSRQRPDGGWEQLDPRVRTPIPGWGGGQVPDTCFALLFLYKGRAPVLFNKIRFDGAWNLHRRDVANLTRYIEWAKEQQFHWQIVDLAAPLEELHDAPILFITAESLPKWTADDRRKLRAFTDTGGTILFEASCGNPPVREWFAKFAREVWPEWPLQPLGPDHPVFADPYPLATTRPEILGASDGLRTFLYYAMDDVSCPWHMKAYASKEYLFRWGINLFTCATDHAPLRAKLAGAEPAKSDKYAATPRPGPRKTLRLARLRHSGNWEAGANYGALRQLAAHFKDTLGVTIAVAEPAAPPFNSGGVAAADLKGYDVAYLTGSRAMTLSAAEKDALKAWVAGGGMLWAEAAGGSVEFDASLRTLAADAGWELRLLANDHPLMTGAMGLAQGYDLASGVAFRRALRMARAAKPFAELWGLFAGDKRVGVYSPLDACWSASPYEAYDCRGYRPPDAAAVVTNILLSFTVPPGAPTTPAPTESPFLTPAPGPTSPGPSAPPPMLTPAPTPG